MCVETIGLGTDNWYCSGIDWIVLIPMTIGKPYFIQYPILIPCSDTTTALPFNTQCHSYTVPVNQSLTWKGSRHPSTNTTNCSSSVYGEENKCEICHHLLHFWCFFEHVLVFPAPWWWIYSGWKQIVASLYCCHLLFVGFNSIYLACYRLVTWVAAL